MKRRLLWRLCDLLVRSACWSATRAMECDLRKPIEEVRVSVHVRFRPALPKHLLLLHARFPRAKVVQ